MASEWSIRCSFISYGPVHLRKWEKARQTHGPDVAEFIRYFHTNWIYPIQSLSGIRKIIRTLLPACFHTILHRNLSWLEASQMKPCLHQCVFLWAPNWVNEEKMWKYIFIKTGEGLFTFSEALCCPSEVQRKKSRSHFSMLKKGKLSLF